MIHVFLGTKAQYIKTAPLLRLMDAEQVRYRLIDSGQHGALSPTLRRELGVREPDLVLGGDRNVDSIPQAVAWAARLATRLVSGRALRRDVFGGEAGVCVVHGDTPSTLLSAMMAHRAGLDVAHLEAGLRSHRLFDPFPEELIRILVMRWADVLFAPDDEAVSNLAAMRTRGQVVPVEANTVVEALAYALRDAGPGGGGPVVVTMHRVENLKRSGRVDGFVSLVTDIARSHPVRFVMHGPTVATLEQAGAMGRLRDASVELVELQPHAEFVRMLHAAPFVVTDGGSIQEECALLGVPTLLWRQRSERPDGIGANVVVSGHDLARARAFVADPERHRRPLSTPDVTPSAQILEVLEAHA